MTLWSYRDLFKSLLPDIIQNWVISRYYEIRYVPENRELEMYYNELYGILTGLKSINVTGGNKYMIMKLMVKRLGLVDRDKILAMLGTWPNEYEPNTRQYYAKGFVGHNFNEDLFDIATDLSDNLNRLLMMIGEDEETYPLKDYLGEWFPNLKKYNPSK